MSRSSSRLKLLSTSISAFPRSRFPTADMMSGLLPREPSTLMTVEGPKVMEDSPSMFTAPLPVNRASVMVIAPLASTVMSSRVVLREELMIVEARLALPPAVRVVGPFTVRRLLLRSRSVAAFRVRLLPSVSKSSTTRLVSPRLSAPLVVSIRVFPSNWRVF